MNILFVLLSLTFGWIILPSKVLVYAIQVYEHHENDLTTASTVLMMITSSTTAIPPTTPIPDSSIIIANTTIEASDNNTTDIENSIQSNSNKTNDHASDKLQAPTDLLHIESNINATGPVQYPTNEPSTTKVFSTTNAPLHTPRIAEPFLGAKHHQIDQQQKSTIAHHINHKKFTPSPQLSAGIINSQITNNNNNNKRENFLPSNQYYKPLSYEPYYNYKIPATMPTIPSTTTIKPISTNHSPNQQESSQQSQQQSSGKQIEINDGFIVSSGPYFPKFVDTPNHYQHHHEHYHELSKPKINWSIQSAQQPASSMVATPPSGPGGTSIICDPPPSTLQFPENGKWYWLPNSTPEIPIIPEKPSSLPAQPSQAPVANVDNGHSGSSSVGSSGGGGISDAWKWIFENNTPKLVPNHQHHSAHHNSHHHQVMHSSHPYSFEVISTAGPPPPSQGSPFNFPTGGELVPQPPSYGSGGLEYSEWPPSSSPPIPPQFLQQYFIKEEKRKQTEENIGKENEDSDNDDNEEDIVKSPKKKHNLRPKGLSPLKKILSVLGIALPIGLLISTLTPQVVVVSPNATSPLRPIIPGSNIGSNTNDALRSKYDHNNYLNNGFFHKSYLHRSVDNNNDNNNMDGITDDINNSGINIENIQLDPKELSEFEQNLSEKNPLIEFLTILDKQNSNIKSSVHRNGSYDDDADDKHECDSRQFCEVARLGSTPNANVLNRMLWKVANKTSKSQAIKSGLYEIFRAIRNNNCKVFICKNYQPYQSLQQINHQNVSSNVSSQQKQQHPSALQQYPQQYH